MARNGQLRVLLIASSLAKTSGGGSVFLNGLIEGLAAADGIELAVAGPVECMSARLGQSGQSVELIDIPARGGVTRPLTDALATLRANRWGADVVHYPHDWCPPSRCPVVLTIQNIGPFDSRSARDMGARGKALRQLSKRTAGRAAAIVAVSETARNVWNRAVSSAPATDLIPEGFTAPSPVDPTVAHAPPAGVPARDFVLAITGPARYKNADLTLSVMWRHATLDPNATWVIAGIPQGSWHDGRQRIGVGSPKREVLLELMAAARCVVFLSAVESFGLPALEAVAMGTHPIVLEGTAMAEWLQSRCSAVSGTESAVIGAIQMASRSADHVNGWLDMVPPRFDWRNIAHEYEAVYRRVAGAGR